MISGALHRPSCPPTHPNGWPCLHLLLSSFMIFCLSHHKVTAGRGLGWAQARLLTRCFWGVNTLSEPGIKDTAAYPPSTLLNSFFFPFWANNCESPLFCSAASDWLPTVTGCLTHMHLHTLTTHTIKLLLGFSPVATYLVVYSPLSVRALTWRKVTVKMFK